MPSDSVFPSASFASGVPAFTCEAFGSNDYTAIIDTGGLRGYTQLGFLEQCNTPDVISSSCEIVARAGRLTGKRGVNTHGGRKCSSDSVVGPNWRGQTGSLTADWGAYNSTGYFAQLGGCIVDGKTAYCRYHTTIRVGRHNYFGLVPHTP
jgi:hypothetical protein